MTESDRRVLVAGGAGFLGSHLCDRLIATGAQVYCVDNFLTGTRAKVAHLISHPHFKLIEHDVISPLPDLAVDEIYNLACPASPPQYQRDPIYTTKISVLGALNLLDLAERNGATILQASTSEVYGDPLVHPQTEDYRGNVSTTGPRACYDEGKRCAESVFFDYHRCRNVRIKVARIFNTYGPRMEIEDGRIVSNFVVQALRGQPLTVFGEGLQTRSFCYVSDLIDGLMRLMASPDEVTGPINLGNPTEYSVREIATKVIALTGSTAGIAFKPLPKDDPERRRPQIDLAYEVLGWKPTVALEGGLAETVSWFAGALELNERRAASRAGTGRSHEQVAVADPA